MEKLAAACYHLPGLFEFYELYRRFLPLYREHREYFYDWCAIGSIYGAPAGCIWGGGRISCGGAAAREVLALLRELVAAKKEYDHVAQALQSVRETGYGLVPPQLDELTLQEPEIMGKGGKFGVRLRASAPSLHLIRVDIQTEVSPVVGTEQQSEEMLRYLMEGFEQDPQKLWQSNLFGKPLSDLVREGLSNKLMHMPEDTQLKVQQTLEKIINEGNGGMVCILL